MMDTKNVQVIYGALNSVFEIYEIPDDLFNVMFPNGTDMAFTDEVDKAFRGRGGRKLWNIVYGRPVDKKRVRGIHGTLHLETSPVAREFFPTRKEAEMLRGEAVPPLRRFRTKRRKRSSKTGSRRRAGKR